MLRVGLRTAASARSNPVLRVPAALPRHLSSSPCLLARPPSFTTPELPPTTYDDHDPTRPLPPTDLPVEDYASPLLHTASLFGSLFRYATFASVTIVLVGLGGLTGLHLWVEKVELAGPRREDEERDTQRWSEEVEGWTGGYRGGGTDPRLGTFARAAIRGAWISQHWGGGVGSPVAASVGSPFGAGGAMIGSVADSGLGKEVGDAGWQMAESYLVYALGKVEKKGISLVFPDSGPRGTHQVDRAAVELEERLAGLRERIGGRFKLEQAREGWERVYYALSASTEPTGWQKRERIRATKKLGDLSARLADMWREGSEERALEKVKAEGWFLGGLLPALAEVEGESLVREKVDKVASPAASFFAFWSHSHPPSQTDTHTPISSTLRPELAKLVHLLDHHVASASPTSHPDPAASRAILNSLVSLETFLARDRNLVAAESVQRAALAFAQSLHLSPHFSSQKRISTWLYSRDTPAPVPSSTLPWTDSAWVGPSLSQIFLITRTSLFSTHLAEVSLALSQPEPAALMLLQGAINDCERAVAVLETSPFVKPLSGLAKLSSSKEARLRREYEKGARGAWRDARVTGSMAARLVAFVHERGCGGGAGVKRSKREESRVKEWCGGDVTAESFFAKAMDFSGGEKVEGEVKAVDERGFREAEIGFERTRKRVLEAEGSTK